MTTVKRIGSTAATEIGMSKATVLVSYNTPVAAFILGRGYVRTDKFYSVTTSKHINQWLRSKNALERCETVPQAELDALL